MCTKNSTDAVGIQGKVIQWNRNSSQWFNWSILYQYTQTHARNMYVRQNRQNSMGDGMAWAGPIYVLFLHKWGRIHSLTTHNVLNIIIICCLSFCVCFYCIQCNMLVHLSLSSSSSSYFKRPEWYVCVPIIFYNPISIILPA